MKIRKGIIAGLFLALGLMLTAPQAQVEAVSSIESCPGDYYSFIAHARSEHTRHEYFQDFFKRNFCQVSDIILLNDQLEDLRDSFRDAAFACEDTSAHKKEYIRILLETYFVRHVQEFSAGTLEEHERDDLENRRRATLNELQEEMHSLFVVEEAQVSASDLDSYFNTWSIKYDDKIIDYAACDEGPWAEVNEVAADFQKTIDRFETAVEKKKRSEKLIQISGEVETDTSDWTRVKNSMNAFFQKFKKQEEEEVEDALTPNEAAKRGGNLSGAFDLLEESDLNFAIETESASRMARYQILYGEGGARTSSELQGLINGINETVEDTNASDFPNIIKNARKVIDKQCS